MDWDGSILSDLGEACPGFRPDGHIYRFGKKDKLWAVGFEYQGRSQKFVNVVYGDWSEGTVHHWKSYAEAQLSERQKREIEVRADAVKSEIAKERKIKSDLAAKKWKIIFDAAIFSDAAHPYLKSKGLEMNFSSRVSNEDLLIPMYLGGEFRGVQRIYKDGGEFIKRFPSGTGVKGCYSPINKDASSEKIFISEGFATACSVSLAMPQYLSICCFSAGNIYPVIEGLRQKTRSDIIICADLDKNGVGESKAKEAIKYFDNVSYVLPKFPQSISGMTDFNDLHSSCGLEEIKKQLFIHSKNDHLWPTKCLGFTHITEKGSRIRQYDDLFHYFSHMTGFKYIPEIQTGYKFNGKFYESLPLDYLVEFADVNFLSPVKNFERQEFVAKCKARSLVDKNFLERQDAVKQINFNNGVLDLDTMDIVPHSIKYPFTYVIPNDFKRGVECPTWTLLLDRIFLGRRHLIDNLEEFVGFCLSRENYFRFNQALVLDGEGSNGKSTLINAIKMIIGANNCESISLAAMGQNRFLAHKLFKSMVNFCEEEPKAVFTETGSFKKLTGNSPMFAEEKNKSGFSFVNKSKIIISYNEMPYLGDETVGMRRRLLILPCEQDFDNNLDRRIENVLAKVEQELPGIIERCVLAYVRLSKRGHFNIPEETKVRFKQMRMDSNPVYGWWDDHITLNFSGELTDPVIRTDVLWEAFKADTETKTYTKNGFMKKVGLILRELNKEKKTNLEIGRNHAGKFIRGVEYRQ